LVAPVLLGGLITAPAGQADAQVGNRSSPKQNVCYQIATDRFFDGTTANTNPAQSLGLHQATKTNWRQYWGGDFAGIQQKLPYQKNIGVTSKSLRMSTRLTCRSSTAV